jgi:hypothetical protein
LYPSAPHSYPQTAGAGILFELDYARDIGGFLQACEHAFGEDHLKSLQVIWSPLGSEPALDVQDLRCLFTFKKLRELVLYAHGDTILYDCDILELLEAWPDLELLELPSAKESDSDDEETILSPSADDSEEEAPSAIAIVTLLSRCPKLKRLKIPWDPSSITEKSFTSLVGDVRAKSMVWLVSTNADALFTNVTAVASFLMLLAPNLQSVVEDLEKVNRRVFYDYPDEVMAHCQWERRGDGLAKTGWDAVDALLQPLRLARSLGE